MVDIIAVHLCPDADNSISLLFLCIACLNYFDTVKCLMEAVYVQPYMHAGSVSTALQAVYPQPYRQCIHSPTGSVSTALHACICE